MHKDVIRRPLQSRCTEYMPKAIYELLYAGWSVYMQVGRARIASRPRTCMQKRNKVRDMIRMEMRHNDVIQLIVLDTDLKKPLDYSVPAVKEHRCVIQSYKHARCASLEFNLAGSGAKKRNAAHR